MMRKPAKTQARSRKRSRKATTLAAAVQPPVERQLPKLVAFKATSQPAFQFSLDGQTSTFFGDVSNSKEMTSNGVANARSLSSSSGIVYPLYAANDPFYQMACEAECYRKELDEKAIGIAAVENDLFILGMAQKEGSLQVSADVWSDVSAQNDRACPPANQISTVLYPQDAAAAWISGAGDLEVAELKTEASYQTFHEIPSSAKQDYSTGRVLANSFLVKSYMDGQYSMDHSSGKLCHSRRYTGIGSCGDKLYLTYEDSANFGADGKAVDDSCGLLLGFPRVEIVASLRREADSGKPKRLASLYSIDVHSPIIDAVRKTAESGDRSSQYVDRIEKEMQNGIAKIAESVQPAQLQLFKVNVDGI